MPARIITYLEYALLAAAGSVAAWWLWLGWDTEYDVGPSGTVSGPYEAWQVIGLALTLGLIAGVAAWRISFLVVAPAIALPFTVAWSIDAAAHDESGLWAVGAILVLGGTTLGTGLVAGIVNALRRRSRPASA